MFHILEHLSESLLPKGAMSHQGVPITSGHDIRIVFQKSQK